jgi:peroxiredoxin
MKLVCTSALVAALSASTFGQDTSAPSQPAPTPIRQAEPAKEPAPAPDPEAVKKAEKVIGDMSKTYKEAKAITDTLQLKMETPMGAQEQEMTITIGKDKDAMLAFGGMTLIAVDGKLHFIRDDVADKYFSTPMEGTLQNALDSVFGGGFPLPPQFVLRTDATPEQVVKSASLGMMNDPKLTGYREATTDDGAKMHEITFASTEGTGAMQVSVDTNLLKRVMMELTPEGMPAGMSFKATLILSPKLLDELPKPIAFNAGDRKSVESLDELAPTPIQVGDEAPDFTLPTLAGEKVTLSELRGNVVVLDFWATWCNPCRRALPLLEEFNTWAQSSGQKVKVYAVNVSERDKDAEVRKTKVQEFWTKAEYKMPTLVDYDNAVFPKYGFDGIPATVVVGPDGKVVAVHSGFSPEMVDMLKKDVEAATKTAG